MKNKKLKTYLGDFNHLQISMSKKYGEPDKLDRTNPNIPVELWHNQNRETATMPKEMAIMKGYLTMFQLWTDDETEIMLSMTKGENDVPIAIRIYYTSLRLKPLVMAEKNRPQHDNLSTDGL